VTGLSLPSAKGRFFSRLQAPASPGETRRVERWLATARVFLAISALVAIWIDPAQLGYSPWAYWFLGLYIVHGVVVMLLLRFRKESTAAFRVLVHAADILWPALVSLFATGQRSPFFLFFVFVLGAAAYRWGLRETVGTAMATVVLLWLESVAVQQGFVVWLDRLLERHHLPLMGINVPDLEPKRLFMLSVYLLVMGVLLGYLAEQQKQLRAERAVIARVLGRVRVEEGLSGTLREILAELLKLYGAQRSLIASQETHSFRVFVGEVRRGDSGPSELHWLESSPTDRETYLFDSEADAWLANCGADGPAKVLALDADGVRLRTPSCQGTENLARLHSFSSVAAVSFTFGNEWWGRIFLLEPMVGGDREEELRFLQELVRQVGPAVYNVYLLRRLRQRAGAVERARVARELHDGAVQSLIAMEMQVDVLRRKSEAQAGPLTSELGRIQSLLREEVLKLRELMQQMKSLDVDSTNLLRFMVDTVERFQRETGITTRFLSDLESIEMPQRVCRELVRIVQEGLVNVRKHSAAHNVLVHLGSRDGLWRLSVEDDGQGFPFAGRYSQSELEAMGQGPVVIRERVRLIAGELTVESSPSRGSRLEVTVPRHREVIYGQ
jgi:signal transduction histidine kinase